ncbi:hypothetical protein [Aquimarina sp. MMG016]|uniref:hypothetical protein n=1 Tax=Aquimarina sp. MMG016 TaxID=2822690 RepID=UPI001B39ED06|nr:hypothetical protein [Aquimarina sp. MMG016]MBQ4820555.1 hypothetical protein [Aquimarina sp. MMG016]
MLVLNFRLTIKERNKVKWSQDKTILFGTVIETYAYKITKELKRKFNIDKNVANMVLNIKRSDGLHVLKNDTDVYPL